MAENKKYIGNGQLKGNPNQKLSLIIKDGAVDTAKLADGAITNDKLHDNVVTKDKIADGNVDWGKLDHSLQVTIASREEGGVALADDFGDSELLGITQKKLTEANQSLQEQINAIVNDKATVSLNGPSAIFVGTESTFTLTATTNTDSQSIEILKGNTRIAYQERGDSALKNLQVTETITPSSAESISYTAKFNISGIIKPASRSVAAVHKIYYGSGMTWTDANQTLSARTSPAGTYTINVTTDGDHLFFVIPASMVANKTVTATKGGFDFPLSAPASVQKDDGGVSNVAYKVYSDASAVGYSTGSETITLIVN